MDDLQVINEMGFESVGRMDAAALKTVPEVRAMCASGKCPTYGTNWACPPHSGELEDFQAAFAEKDQCYVLQTVMEMEDEFDVETMEEAQQVHGKRIRALADALAGTGAMVLSAGTCTFCPTCTCPDDPCRFPDKRLVSMEAAGLLVSDVCTQAGIPYNHGPNTIAYTGCLIR